ncbi:MAG: homocysteine S-methyltransferase family protein [Promethearchaeota archaeon]
MSFRDWLKDSTKIILFDGGMGSEVFKRGITPGKLPDTLNLDHPDVIFEIHKAYYDAGADRSNQRNKPGRYRKHKKGPSSKSFNSSRYWTLG